MAEFDKNKEIEDEVNAMNASLKVVKRDTPKFQFPISSTEGISLGNFTTEQAMNLVWNKVWYFNTIFEAVDGYDVILGGAGGGVVVDPDGIVLSTGPTTNNSATFHRAPNPSLGGATAAIDILSWNKPQRFRTSFVVNSVANITAYMTRGADLGSTYPFFGFKISNATLQGVARDGNASGETTVDLATIVATTNYVVEARFLPGTRIEFYLLNNTTKIFELKGQLTTDLPVSTNANTEAFFEYLVSTQANADKQLASAYFEYVQERNF